MVVSDMTSRSFTRRNEVWEDGGWRLQQSFQASARLTGRSRNLIRLASASNMRDAVGRCGTWKLICWAFIASRSWEPWLAPA